MSLAQRKAIVIAQSHAYSFHFHKSLPEGTIAWMSVFMRHTRNVYDQISVDLQSSRAGNSVSHSRCGRRLLNVSLRCRISCECYLPSRKAAALQEISISLYEDGPWVMFTTGLLLQSLRALRLRKLGLRCFARCESECQFARSERMSDGPHMLARCCPDLTAFETDACSQDHPGDP